jgi:hypothetical protein
VWNCPYVKYMLDHCIEENFRNIISDKIWDHEVIQKDFKRKSRFGVFTAVLLSCES